MLFQIFKKEYQFLCKFELINQIRIKREKNCFKDFEKLKEKQEKQKVKQESALEKEKRLERMKEKFEVDYDPERLYRPTSTWQTRLNTPRSQEKVSMSRVNSMPQVQHLMVPTWRQGI